MGKAEFQAWTGAIFKLYASLRPRNEQGEVRHATMYQLAHEMQAPLPLDLLHIHKLRLAAQLFECGDDFVFGAIIMNWKYAADDSWLAGLYRSLVWLYDQIGDDHCMEACRDLHTLEKWFELKDFAKYFKKAIRRAEQTHMLRVRNIWELKQHEQQQSQMLQEMGWTQDMETQPDSDREQHYCPECNKSFDTAASLAVHEQRQHGKRVAVRRYVQDAACRACNRYFTPEDVWSNIYIMVRRTVGVSWCVGWSH